MTFNHNTVILGDECRIFETFCENNKLKRSEGLTWSDDEFMKTICARRPDLSYCTGKFLNGSISSDIQNSTFPPDSNSGSAENISKDYSDRQKPVEEAAERFQHLYYLLLVKKL